MSRVIKTESAGKDRNRLTRSIVLAIRELMKQPEPNDTARDMAAYIALGLLEISGTIEESVAAWEKKGYWVKADRFRMEWEWTGRIGAQMKTAVLQADWGTVAGLSAQVAQKLMKVTIPEHHRLGAPWVGSWKNLQSLK